VDQCFWRLRETLGRLLRTEAVLYGCDYCADDANRFYGHVTQIASDADRGFILLQCPDCGALYENTPGGFDETRRLSVSEARQAFPTWATANDTAERGSITASPMEGQTRSPIDAGMSDRAGDADEDFVKVNLTSDAGRVETLWAVRVGDGRFELRNVPMFAYGVSDNDVVEGVEYEPQMYEFIRVVQPSGNRVVRVILAPDATADTDAGKAVITGLTALGCNYENFNGRWIGVVVPPSVKLGRVATYLIGTGLTWEYANPTYDDLFSPASGSRSDVT
jgi:hypothetical protein